MAEAGIFIGWGANFPGREAKGLEVFNEASSTGAGSSRTARSSRSRWCCSLPTEVTSRASRSCAGAATRWARCSWTRSSSA